MGPLGSKRYVDVVCFDIQLDTGGDSGKPFANLSLRIVDGPDAGVNLYRKCYLTAAALPYTMKALKCLGWTGTKLSKAMAEGLGTRKAQAQLVVKQLDNGKVVEDVKGIYEPLGPRRSETAVDADSLDAFDALFEDAAANAEGPGPLTEANKAPPLPPAVKRAAGPVVQAEPDPF